MNRTDRRDRNEEQADQLYDRLYCEVEDEQRSEWVAEFGADNPLFPFKPSGIHELVSKRMQLIARNRMSN